MIDYLKNLYFEKIKAKVSLEKAKPLGIAAICFVAVFAAGYGVGTSSKQQGGGGSGVSATKRSSNSNYTTNSNANANGATKNDNPEAGAPANTTNTNTTAATGAVDTANCKIKGSKSKIYHMPGGAFYNRTTPVACFNTEEEAQSAGYTKSSR